MGFLREFLRIQTNKLTAGAGRTPGPRADENLPLKMQIGGYVRFEQTPFIICKAAGLFVGNPSTRMIAAIGRIKAEGFTIHRAYLQEGDQEIDYLLQIITGPDGKFDGVPRLYHIHEEIEPSSPDEWRTWLCANEAEVKKAQTTTNPEECPLIGYETFGLHNAEGALLAEYRRVWPKPNDPAMWSKPREFSETLYTSPYGGSPMRARHDATLYGRQPERPKDFPVGAEMPAEWAMLSAVDYQSKAVMQIHVGVDLEFRHLTVLPAAAAAA